MSVCPRLSLTGENPSWAPMGAVMLGRSSGPTAGSERLLSACLSGRAALAWHVPTTWSAEAGAERATRQREGWAASGQATSWGSQAIWASLLARRPVADQKYVGSTQATFYGSSLSDPHTQALCSLAASSRACANSFSDRRKQSNDAAIDHQQERVCEKTLGRETVHVAAP